LRSGLQWQHWEEFTASFRILKSLLLNGQTITVSKLHSGAIFSQEVENLNVQVTKLDLYHATHQVKTKSN
jgi:hypothetical protein